MNAKIYVFVICVEATIYLLLCNSHDCTFNLVKFFESKIDLIMYTSKFDKFLFDQIFKK